MADESSEMQGVLGEHWFPVNEVSIESVRERSAFTALPPHYALHVWFARRPLVASRAAIVAALLPTTIGHKDFLNLNGIPTDIDMVRAYNEFLRSKTEKRKIIRPFSWKRAFTHTPTSEELDVFHASISSSAKENVLLLDPFAGGGSIPLEAIRLGLNVIANDLNPVAFVCLKGTVDYPARFGDRLISATEDFCGRVHAIAETKLAPYYPKHAGEEIYAYLWAKTVRCNHCGFIVPLSPNWWIMKTENEKVAARLIVDEGQKQCRFEIVKDPQIIDFDPNEGTTRSGDASCPKCRSTIGDNWIKTEAQGGRMGDQLYAVCAKIHKRKGKGMDWHFRSPTQDELDALERAEGYVNRQLGKWISDKLIPSETFSENVNDTRPIEYGMPYWYSLFNFRQLLSHAKYVEAFKEARSLLFSGISEGSEEWEFAKAISIYGAIVFDSCVNYNSLQARWHSGRAVMSSSMELQGFPFRASYGEFDHSSMLWPWAQKKTLKTLRDIIDLLPNGVGRAIVLNRAAQSTGIQDDSVNAIITDPPYVGNVMYAEISDFFYVWLRLLIGDLFPDEFSESLTNKIDEAVANPARFTGAKRGQANLLAAQDYAAKMEAAFRECRRVLRDDGILCVMFTHRTRDAWQGLAESLINAGFNLHASWPVRTEPGQKFGKADKGALKVTVLIYCSKRKEDRPGRWENVVESIRDVAREKVQEYKNFGISGPDLIVSVYGPALGEFSRYYPVRDVTGKVIRAGDALVVVAQVVNEYLTGDIQGADASTLSYLNLLRFNPGLIVEEDFARIITVFGGNSGVDALDVRGGAGLIKKEKGKIKILTAKDRIAEGVLNPAQPDKLKGLMDVVHAAIILYEQKGLSAVTRLLEETGRDSKDDGLLSALAVIGGIREDADSKLISEASIATALLEALGRTTVSMSRRGEKITDY